MQVSESLPDLANAMQVRWIPKPLQHPLISLHSARVARPGTFRKTVTKNRVVASISPTPTLQEPTYASGTRTSRRPYIMSLEGPARAAKATAPSPYMSPILNSNSDVMTRKAGRVTYIPTRFANEWRTDQGQGTDSVLKRAVQAATARWSFKLSGSDVLDCIGGVGAPPPNNGAVPIATLDCSGRPLPALDGKEMIRIQTLPSADPAMAFSGSK